jgi:hypothetical protein
MEVAVLPVDCVLDAISRLLLLKVGPNKNGQETLVSLCVSLGLSPGTISPKSLTGKKLMVGILKHQCEKHQYKIVLPLNTRMDLLLPTRTARAEVEEKSLIELGFRSVEVQTEPTLSPTLSETLCSLTTPRVVSVDASIQTDKRQSTSVISTRNNRLLSTIPVSFTSPQKRASTTPEPESQTPPKVQKTNSVQVEETKQEHSDTVHSRKRRSLGYRNKAKTRSAHPSEMERVETTHSSQLKEKGVFALRAMEALVLGMPWSNELDSNGTVIRLGKRDLALYVAVESIAEGCELETSCSLATRLFDVPADTIRKAWYAFQKNDYTFVTSMRGKHPKLQWTLEDCGVKVRPC